jgi:hypothetical protein
MKRLLQSLITVALMASIGLHWVLLQSAAWIGMAVAYSVETGSVIEGVSDTFDGKHPCPLCKAVAKGLEEDRDAPARDRPSAPLEKAKEWPATLATVVAPRFFAPVRGMICWSAAILSPGRSLDSPLPPPPERA